MAWIPFLKKNDSFFTEEEQKRIINAVNDAERKTSGEVRLYVESKCRFMDAIDRAKEIFVSLKMEQTKDRNAVLVYAALKDRQLAIYADEGIYKAMGKEFWDKEVAKMIREFAGQHYVEGIIDIIHDIGDALQKNFPYDGSTDKNELPDDIVFGK